MPADHQLRPHPPDGIGELDRTDVLVLASREIWIAIAAPIGRLMADDDVNTERDLRVDRGERGWAVHPVPVHETIRPRRQPDAHPFKIRQFVDQNMQVSAIEAYEVL